MLRGYSAESLARAEDRLTDLAGAGDATALGDELFAVGNLMSQEGSLRRALTDPSADPSAKSDLVRGVLGGRVSDATVEVVAAAAAGRWSTGTDFLDALEHLGTSAYVLAAERDGGIDDLEDELFRFGRIVAANPQLRDALANPQLPVPLRQQLVRRLLDGKASRATVRLAEHAVSARHRSFEGALENFQRIAAERQQRMVAVVRTAIALTGDEQDRLVRALRRIYGRDMHLNVVVEPGLLGGIRIELGNDVIDGTVLTRLHDARRQITT